MRSVWQILLCLAVLTACWALVAACSGDGSDDDDDAVDDDDTADDDDDIDDDDDDIDDDDDDDDDIEYDPSEPGPYEVGNRTFLYVDESRWDPASDSARTLLVEVWYPATDESSLLPRDILRNFFDVWDDEVLDRLAQEGATPEDLANFDRETGSARDADMKISDGPFPMILFSHGLGGIRFQNYTQCEHLASHGFIVVAPDHTGNALVTTLPLQLIEFREDLVPISFGQRKNDLYFLIDTFTDLTDFDPDEFFTGAIDIEQIGSMGHSFGGTAVIEATKSDDRIRATVDMASFMFPILPEGFSASAMFMIGLEDNTMGDVTFLMRYDYDLCPPPKFKLEFFDGGHYTFTDVCILLPSLMGDGDGCGMGERRESGDEFEYIGHDEATAIINSYLTAFYGYNLRGEGHMQAYLFENHFTDDIDYECMFP